MANPKTRQRLNLDRVPTYFGALAKSRPRLIPLLLHSGQLHNPLFRRNVCAGMRSIATGMEWQMLLITALDSWNIRNLFPGVKKNLSLGRLVKIPNQCTGQSVVDYHIAQHDAVYQQIMHASFIHWLVKQRCKWTKTKSSLSCFILLFLTGPHHWHFHDFITQLYPIPWRNFNF